MKWLSDSDEMTHFISFWKNKMNCISCDTCLSTSVSSSHFSGGVYRKSCAHQQFLKVLNYWIDRRQPLRHPLYWDEDECDDHENNYRKTPYIANWEICGYIYKCYFQMWYFSLICIEIYVNNNIWWVDIIVVGL